MKAAILNNFGEPLTIEDVPDPTLGTGEVIVDVAAAPVLSYADEVIVSAVNQAGVRPDRQVASGQ